MYDKINSKMEEAKTKNQVCHSDLTEQKAVTRHFFLFSFLFFWGWWCLKSLLQKQLPLLLPLTNRKCSQATTSLTMTADLSANRTEMIRVDVSPTSKQMHVNQDRICYQITELVYDLLSMLYCLSPTENSV